jgi:hypothetical protein
MEVTHLVGRIGPVNRNDIVVSSCLAVCDELFAGAAGKFLFGDLDNYTGNPIEVSGLP